MTKSRLVRASLISLVCILALSLAAACGVQQSGTSGDVDTTIDGLPPEFQRLAAVGMNLYYKTSVGDNPGRQSPLLGRLG